ncbi:MULTISPECIES: hypothetical protein [Streptomyces]|uniref:hypothetical protein n=1 Tax=Streptomyces TaxID=1883 RepID=UPI0006917813|nr:MULTISPECIES: hypothetical protein [Streptomyces]
MTNQLTQRYVASVDDRTVRDAVQKAVDVELLRVAYGGAFLSRPVFLDHAQQEGLGRDLAGVFRLLTSLPGLVTDGDLGRYCELVGMTPSQAAAVRRTAGAPPVPLGRADLYHDGEGFRLLEFNISSALGGFENAEINRALRDVPAIADFTERERLRHVDTLGEIVRVMLDTHSAPFWGDRPFVALVDTPASFPGLERRLGFMAELLSAYGVDAVACHTGQIEARDGRLYVGDRPVDIVYRFFIIEDLLEETGELELIDPILRCHENGGVTVFAPLDTEMYGNKRALALLGDERVRQSLSAEDLALVDRFVPWTRRVRRGEVEVGGAYVDLEAYCVENRADLVLKPSLLHGGMGFAAGWLMSEAEWRSALDDAMRSPFVVQRRVAPGPETFTDGDVTGPSVLNWGVFMAGDRYAGAIVRGVADPDVGVVSMGSGARVGGCFHGPDPSAAL